MSTDIHEGVVSATRFSGGSKAGMCIQISSSMPRLREMGPGLGRFIQGPYEDVVAMCRAVVKFDDERQPKTPIVQAIKDLRRAICGRWVNGEACNECAERADALIAKIVTPEPSSPQTLETRIERLEKDVRYLNEFTGATR